jgi:hypothetical protein
VKSKTYGILGILGIVLFVVAMSGCVSDTSNNTTATAPVQNTSAPAAPANTDTSTQTESTQTTPKEAANINPVDGTVGVYQGKFSGYPGYVSSDGTILWIADKKTHTKMYGYMSTYEANGNQWNDGDLTTVPWNG